MVSNLSARRVRNRKDAEGLNQRKVYQERKKRYPGINTGGASQGFRDEFYPVALQLKVKSKA